MNEPDWVVVSSINDMERFYKSIIPTIRKAAKDCGYAIGIHGSLRRDMDVIAIPWVAEHKDKDELAHAIQKAACGIVNESYKWESKPAGRFAVSFPVAWHDWHPVDPSTCHIDLSVMPGHKEQS